MEVISIIDLGSNSLKILVTSLNKDNSLNKIYEKKYNIRIGDYIDSEKNLSHIGICNLVFILEDFKKISSDYNATKLITIATESLRKCNNIKYVLDILKDQTDLDIKILSGYNEAYFGYIATKNTLNYSDYYLLDIGGASVEISLIKDNNFIDFVSLPLGAISLSKKFDFKNKVSELTKDKLKEYIFQEFKKYTWLNQKLDLPVICIGGSTKNLATIYTINKLKVSNKNIHNLKIDFNDIYDLNNFICNLNCDDKLKIKGLSKKRADIISASSTFLELFLEYTNSNLVIINKFGIREGIAYDILKDNYSL